MGSNTITRRLVWLAAGALASVAFAGTAGAVELDGNIVHDTATDWADLFDPGDQNTVAKPKNSLPTGIQTAAFYRDFTPGSSSDDTTFTTGSKDIYNVSGGGAASGEWQCTTSNNVSSKGDIIDAYAAVEIVGTDAWLVFGSERSSNKGTAKTSFWFLQDPSVECPAGSGARTFIGNHVNGDLLIVGDFDNGGNIETIQAFRWVGGATGHLDPNPITGLDCRTSSGISGNFCATVNRDVSLTYPGQVPWYVETKAGNTLEPRTFFEGRINLSALNLQRCFNRYMANTRQSTSITSTMFDYVIGDFNVCGVGISKTCDSGRIASDGKSVIYDFTVTIENKGFGTIHDVQLKDAAEGATCGYASYTTVAASLAAGATKTVAVQCTTSGIGLENHAYVRAKSDSGMMVYDINDDYVVGTSGCNPSYDQSLSVGKSCKDVTLVSTASGIDIRVHALLTVTNNGKEALKSVVVSDKDVDGNSISLHQADSSGVPCSGATCTFAGDMAPGETLYFLGTWIPPRVDGATIGDPPNDESNPCTAAFKDSLSASGTGWVSDIKYESLQVNKSCPLCACPD